MWPTPPPKPDTSWSFTIPAASGSTPAAHRGGSTPILSSAAPKVCSSIAAQLGGRHKRYLQSTNIVILLLGCTSDSILQAKAQENCKKPLTRNNLCFIIKK